MLLAQERFKDIRERIAPLLAAFGIGGTLPYSYCLTRWLFLRGLGFIYLFAFLTLGVQITGLIGSHGILPVSDLLAEQPNVMSLVRLNSSDAFLQFLCFGGAVFAILLILDIAPPLMCILCWVFYLSLVNAGQDFMAFQWDTLLLETGFLAIFFAPFYLLPRRNRTTNPSRVVLWLIRLLLFRLNFMSGVLKLANHDPNWRNLTALHYHYFTQPLPTSIAWYFYQLPLWFHEISTAMVFVIEILAPFLIFAPRRFRLIGAGLLAMLQILIFITGNFAFFNLLTLVLITSLLDDQFLRRFFPRRLAEVIMNAQPALISIPRRVIEAIVGVIIVIAGFAQIAGLYSLEMPAPVAEILRPLSDFFIVNWYGLFATMTTTRPEIIIEGSNDGSTWLPYEFPYKAGDLARAAVFVAPYQPRIDFQLWFAALGTYDQNLWFTRLLDRLLEGSPDVLALLAKNPFPNAPPRYIRAMLYNYEYSDFATRQATGNWWQRTLIGPYSPVLSNR